MDKIEQVQICKMTVAQMHAFFKEFTYDPATFADPSKMELYVYDAKLVDAYCKKHEEQGKMHFAILLGNKVIGDIYLKQVNHDKHTCEIGIHLINDCYKNKGYGTNAIKLLLSYAFNELKMEKVFANSLVANTRSQRVLAKAGFVLTKRDEVYFYYECSHNAWYKQNSHSKTRQPMDVSL